MTLLLGCTSAEPKVPADRDLEGDDLLLPSEVDVLLIAESSSPVSGSGHTLTIFGDGWSTLHTSGGMFMSEADYEAHDYTLRLDREALDRVRALLADDGFGSAESDYHERGVHDGGATIFAGGSPARRITVVNRPENLPRALDELKREAIAISKRLEKEGREPYADRDLPARARILLQYDWWGREGGADRLTVFDDGLLEYRRTSSATMPNPDADYPTPVAITRRVEPGALARLRGLVSSRTVLTLPLLGEGDRSGDADSHHFRVRGKTALRFSPAELEPPLQDIVDEVARFLDPIRTEI